MDKRTRLLLSGPNSSFPMKVHTTFRVDIKVSESAHYNLSAATIYPEAKGPEVRISWVEMVEMRRTLRLWCAAADAKRRCSW